MSNQQGKGGKDPFDVPDGGIEELHKYIDGLNKIQPSSSLRPAVAELRKSAPAAQCRACEKILAASPNPQQAQVAVHAKITALLQLGKLGDKTAQPALEAMANQVEKLGLKTMLREVRLAAMQNLGEQADAMEDEQYGKFVDRLKEFLGDGPVDVASANLAMNVAMAAERSIGPCWRSALTKRWEMRWPRARTRQSSTSPRRCWRSPAVGPCGQAVCAPRRDT